jgi:hypothetical protein
LPRSHYIDSKYYAWGEDYLTSTQKKKVSHFTIRTSGRRVFRRCLRKWGFQSSMRQNLQRKGTETNIHFWFGSAIHFAMEDYFGENLFGDLTKAFQAYYAAFPAYERPEGADEHYYLGLGMLEYFKEWYPKHNEDMQFQTVWLDENKQPVEPGTGGARPLVEESFMLDLGLTSWVDVETEEIVKIRDEDVLLDSKGQYVVVYDDSNIFDEPRRRYITKVPIYYHGTMDRIVQDKYGRWWIMDWKTAKGADTNKLDTDDQISAYMWAAEQWLGRPIHGFVYVQLTKDLAKVPKRLATGKLSVDKKQKTTYNLFRKALLDDYGEVRKAPAPMITFLNHLAAQETPEGDRFIRWDLVTRNKGQKESTYRHILAEASMMIDPDLYLFPNPTRDCIWDCPFRDACLMMEKGEEEQAQQWLNEGFEPRPREEDGNIDSWRVNIPWPDKNGNPVGTLVEENLLSPDTSINLILPEKYRKED